MTGLFSIFKNKKNVLFKFNNAIYVKYGINETQPHPFIQKCITEIVMLPVGILLNVEAIMFYCSHTVECKISTYL